MLFRAKEERTRCLLKALIFRSSTQRRLFSAMLESVVEESGWGTCMFAVR